jgi:glycosyltransferase involved in cell wall biosynthesis
VSPVPSHIALLIPTLDRIGGAERQVMLLARGLALRGWRVTVLALSGSGGSAAGELAQAGVAFLSLEMRKGLADPRGWIRLNRWLRSARPDVLHAHLPHAAWLARWSRLGAPVRVQIDTIHTSATGTWGRRVGYRWSCWLPDRVTAVGQAVDDAYLRQRMVRSKQLTVVPNGVDLDAWQPDPAARAAVRLELGVGAEFLWFAAGRFDPVKDYGTLLRALAKTPDGARLAIAGAGPLESEMQQLAGRLGIAQRVRFLGFQPDVRRWMQAADGFVQASRWEGLPMGLLEAGACALPAVATDVPGSREVIVDGQTGWLTPAGDPSALASRMTQLMQASPAAREALGLRARQFVTDRFSLGAVLDRWEALYAELLAANPHARRCSR